MFFLIFFEGIKNALSLHSSYHLSFFINLKGCEREREREREKYVLSRSQFIPNYYPFRLFTF